MKEISRAICGYADKESANKLSRFFKKHTGKNIDFNNIHQYKNGFRLLLFSIPLDTFSQIGISAANMCNSGVIKFHSLDDFVNWYEMEYAKK